jgi:ribosomal protein L19
MPLQPTSVDESTRLVAPTMECLPGLTAIADEVSERWITPRQDGEVMRRWLARIIERNRDGRNARFCVHRASHCAGVERLFMIVRGIRPERGRIALTITVGGLRRDYLT